MQNRTRSALVGVALALGLAGCGTSSAADVASRTVPPAPSTDGSADDLVTSTSLPATAPSTDAEIAESNPESTDAVAPTDAPEPVAAEPAPTEAPASLPAEPVVGGRLFAVDVQPAAQFDANPFPDLVVEDIGKDTQVNIRNILPSDRPVLLWAWAPH